MYRETRQKLAVDVEQLLAEGLSFMAQHKFEEAGDSFRRTILDARRLCDHLTEARALGNLGSVYELLGDTQKAIVTSELCIDKLQHLPERRMDKEAVILGNLTNSHINAEQYDEALVCLDKALAVETELGHDDSVRELEDRRAHVEGLKAGKFAVPERRDSGNSREKRLSIDRGSQDQIAGHIRAKILAGRVRRRWAAKVAATKAAGGKGGGATEGWKLRDPKFVYGGRDGGSGRDEDELAQLSTWDDGGRRGRIRV